MAYANSSQVKRRLTEAEEVLTDAVNVIGDMLNIPRLVRLRLVDALHGARIGIRLANDGVREQGEGKWETQDTIQGAPSTPAPYRSRSSKGAYRR